MNPQFPAPYLPQFRVFFAEDLGEERSVRKNREKIGEEADGTNSREPTVPR
jgi:hypothetical protein